MRAAARRECVWLDEHSPVVADEEFVPTNDLAIFGIFDLKPGRGPAVGLIRTAAPFRDDAFEVALARESKQIAAPSRHR